jgi:hypothetical protein
LIEIWERGLVNLMPELPPLYYTSPRGQCAEMLLTALRDLFLHDGLGVVTKQEAIHYIDKMHWFAIESEDRKPYKSQQWTSGKPRWHTLIAWARKDSVLRDLVSYQSRDAWGLTHAGRSATDRFHDRCRSGKCSVGECFLWSKSFKEFMYQEYKPDLKDARRPKFFYRDQFEKLFDEF